MDVAPQAGVIWDLDGTLADTEEAHFRAWQILCRRLGRELTWDIFKPTFGLGNPDVLRTLLARDLTDDEAQSMSEEKEAIFRAEAAGTIKPMPGALELVRHLYDLGIPQAIGSSSPPENIPFMLREVSAEAYFVATVSRWEVAAGKPAPDIFLRASEKIGIPPSRCLVLEDAPAGVEAAHAAGMRCIVLISTWPEEALSAAEYRVRNLADVRWDAATYAAFAAGTWKP